MSNSPYVVYTRISPNKNSPRTHSIDTITIHCVVGQVTAERLGDIFAPTTKKASSNYGVDKNGRIGMYVEEKDRSWCSSSPANDHRAVTIEVASDTKNPYAVTDAAYESLIKLVADICKRNNIKKLVWSTNKNERVNHLNGCNMTVHRDYANKSCPGEYLYNHMGDIAARVNTIIESPADKLEVDGVWGPATTRRAQEVFKTPVDGEVSNQMYRYKAKNRGLASGWEWKLIPGKNGSALIKAIQTWCGAGVDGFIGPSTISCMQRKLGCSVIDGYVSNPSSMVKAFQKWLNEQ